MKLCSKCSREFKYLTKGLCPGCYRLAHYHRTKVLKDKPIKICSKCSKVTLRLWKTLCSSCYSVERMKQHRDQQSAANKRHRAKHPDYSDKWIAENKDKLVVYRHKSYKLHYTEHYKQYAENVHRRRARLLGAFVAPVDRDTIYERDKGVCGICHLLVGKDVFTIDHKKPLSKGGTHEPSNVQAAHWLCNARKGAHYEEE